MSPAQRASGKGDEDYPDAYVGTPWLTALANFCLVVGVFVGAYAVIFLLGALHKGFRAYWGLILILVIDVVVNLTVQIARALRRRALGLARTEPRGATPSR